MRVHHTSPNLTPAAAAKQGMERRLKWIMSKMKEVGSIDDGTVLQATAGESCFQLASIGTPHREHWYGTGDNGWIRNPGQSGSMRSVDFRYYRTIHQLSVGTARIRRMLGSVLNDRKHLLCATPGDRVDDSGCPESASAQTVVYVIRMATANTCRRITDSHHGCKPLECEVRRRRLAELDTADEKRGSNGGASATAGRTIGWFAIRESGLRKATP